MNALEQICKAGRNKCVRVPLPLRHPHLNTPLLPMRMPAVTPAACCRALHSVSTQVCLHAMRVIMIMIMIMCMCMCVWG